MIAKETTLKEVGAMLTHVVEHMATNEDVAAMNGRMDRIETRLTSVEMHLMSVETRLSSIESELRSIRRDLDDLSEKYENVSGFRKEIDHALERIAAIEEHLGIARRLRREQARQQGPIM
jgi:archaellum component FlaC